MIFKQNYKIICIQFLHILGCWIMHLSWLLCLQFAEEAQLSTIAVTPSNLEDSSNSHSNSAADRVSDTVCVTDDSSASSKHEVDSSTQAAVSDIETKVIKKTSELNTAEQASAVAFIQQLAEFLCSLNECSESSDVDLRLQDFASRFCEG